MAHHHHDLFGAFRRNQRLHDYRRRDEHRSFRAYVCEALVPTLRPGDIVVMDNLGAHKNENTLALIQQAGAEVRFLPAYSPDLNPIEMMWSKVKALLRKAAARTHPDLLAAIAAALSAVTQQDALGWFAACGYNFILNSLRASAERSQRKTRESKLEQWRVG